ncbi:hypothetical protein WMY93_013761 [Mugilogobius chulae]|uniref:Uncharacterized protein n=1 Tax=Mugilogobius chulae TaxID=88201 RepID=A0AAW0P0G8_9GOBI
MSSHAESPAEVKGTALPHKLRLKYRALSNGGAQEPVPVSMSPSPTLPQHPYLALPGNPPSHALGEGKEEQQTEFPEEVKPQGKDVWSLKKREGKKVREVEVDAVRSETELKWDKLVFDNEQFKYRETVFCECRSAHFGRPEQEMIWMSPAGVMLVTRRFHLAEFVTVIVRAGRRSPVQMVY